MHRTQLSEASVMEDSVPSLDPAIMQQMEETFSFDDSVVIAAFQVFKHKRSAEFTGSKLIKALGDKSWRGPNQQEEADEDDDEGEEEDEGPWKSRILCLTVRRAKGTGQSLFRPFLSMLRTSEDEESGYEISRTYALKQIKEIKVPIAKERHERDGAKLRPLDLHIAGQPQQSTGASASAPYRASLRQDESTIIELGFEGEGEGKQMMVLALISELLKQEGGLKVPKMVGIGQEEVDKWWVSHREDALGALGVFAAEVVASASKGAEGDPSKASSSSVLMSVKEERDLRELLEAHAMGIGDIALFEAKLQEEHDALEAANAESVLSSAPLVDSVIFQLQRVHGVLEDVEENLEVLDVKLKHMRGDISAIESSNNLLELQSRNNQLLLKTLGATIDDLKIPKDVKALLNDPDFDIDDPSVIVTAAWSLYDQLQRLTPASSRAAPNAFARVSNLALNTAQGLSTLKASKGNDRDSDQANKQGRKGKVVVGGEDGGEATGQISEHLLTVRVVRDAREAVEDLAGRFVAAATSHLTSAVARAVEEHVAESNKAQKGSERSSPDRILAPPDFHRIIELIDRHQDLVRVISELSSGSCMTRLRQAYCSAVNMLLRKELRSITGELKKAAQLDEQNHPFDYSLTRDTLSAARGSEVTGGGGEGGGGGVASSDGEMSTVSHSDYEGGGGGGGGTKKGSRASAAGGGGGVARSSVGRRGGGGPGSVGGSTRVSHSTTATSVIMVARPKGGSYDGVALSLPLNEAFSSLLQSWIPSLVQMTEGSCSFLLGFDESRLDGKQQQEIAPGGGGGAGGGGKRGKNGRMIGKRGQMKRLASFSEAGEDTALGLESRQALGRKGKLLAPKVGARLIRTLLAGVDEEMRVLVDLTVKKNNHQQVMALPMLAETTQWLNKLQDRPSATPISRSLVECHEKLKEGLDAFVVQQLAAIEEYTKRGTSLGSVKNLHILPFTSQFAIMAHHIETMLAAQQQARGDRNKASLIMAGDEGGRGRDVGGTARQALGLGVIEERQALQDDDDQDDLEGAERYLEGEDGWTKEDQEEEVRERVAAGSKFDTRSELDSIYQRLVGLMFESLEKLAGSDLKHGDRLRLENYTYFTESVWPLARSRRGGGGGGGGGFGYGSREDEGQGSSPPSSSSSLDPFMSQSEARQGEAMRIYVTQQLEWGRFYRLFEFSDKVERLLQVVGVDEISFQPGCSLSEVKSLIQAAMKDAPRKLAKMSARVRKHLGASPLAFKAWGCILEQIVVKYSRLEEQVQKCYPGQSGVVEPTSSQLAEMVEAAPGPGGE